MNKDKLDQAAIPPIIKEYIANAVNPAVPVHIRNNYRDQLANIRQICNDAITHFDREHVKQHAVAKRKPITKNRSR